MEYNNKKKIYQAVRDIFLYTVMGWDAEIVEDHFEEIVDEELISVIDKMFQPVSTPDTLRERLKADAGITDEKINPKEED